MSIIEITLAILLPLVSVPFIVDGIKTIIALEKQMIKEKK